MAARTSTSTKIRTYEDYPFEDLCVYAGIDNIVTSGVLQALMRDIAVEQEYMYFREGRRVIDKVPSIISELVKIKSKAMRFVCDMEVAGMAYDIDRSEVMNQEMTDDINATRERVFQALDRTLNLDSDDDLTQLLYHDMGMKVLLRTKGNQPSTAGDALKALHNEYGYDWLLDIKRYKDVSSMHNSFIRTYVQDWVKKDGRIHPQYNLHGTSSHRISSSNPNLLNLPRGYYGYNIRQLYVVTKGTVFVTFDFSSCEVKILAALSGDPSMIQACRDKLDFHSFTASMMYGIPYDDIMHIKDDKNHPRHKEIKDLRQDAKAVTFGLLYGSSVGGIAMTLGKSMEEAQIIVDTYFDKFPKVKTFIADCHKMAMNNGYIVTPFGQRKQEPGATDVFKGSTAYNASLRNSQNVSIQSPASTLGLVVFAELNERIKAIGGRAICTVYDSIELEIPIDRLAEGIEIGFYVMDDWPVEAFDWLDFAIGADGEIGWNWGDVSEVHRGITQEEAEDMLREMSQESYDECWEEHLKNAA